MKTLDAHAPERSATERSRRRTTLRAAVATTTVLAGLVGATTAGAGGAAAATNPYERGPAPTNASIEASTGPFATAKTTVGRQSSFAGGTIYYPTVTTAGTFGAVVVTPGYTERQSHMAWYGPRIASHGFVVFTIDTNSTLDFPASRSRQMQSAMTYLTGSSTVKSRIDGSRTAFMGHSMGGGGSLNAALARPSTKAIIPLTPWETSKNFSGVTVPTMIIAAENDSIAPAGSHASPFYNSLPSGTRKAYVELNNASHLAPTSPNTTIAKFSIAWLKRWVDNDSRYVPFICNVTTGGSVQSFRSNCPF